MKKISVLGSTGFIGSSTLEILAEFPERFRVVGLAAGRNIDKLLRQIETVRPEVVAVSDAALAETLKKRISSNLPVEIISGDEGIARVATHPEADLVVSAMVGSVGLIPTMAAIQSGKQVALANKETLVVAGRLVMEAARSRGVEIIPVDSEHSAIFQALRGHKRKEVHRVVLTASGGPFRNLDRKELSAVTPEEALRHPTWRMGKKITIDSATMMNKALEVIEARWLFDLAPEAIQIVVHPQSIVHSMVEYCDGSILAQLSVPDMKIPISYALAYPDRFYPLRESLKLAEVGELSFVQPDEDRFPALGLAYRALREEESLCAVLNGANEVAVEAFLEHGLMFSDIPLVVVRTMDQHVPRKVKDVYEALEIDAWARRAAKHLIKDMV